MQYTGCCPSCGGQMKPISIGWKCEKCCGLVDMHGEWHESVNEPFIPDSVLKEQDEATGGKYRRAVEWMGRFGMLFLDKEAAKKEEDTAIMPRMTDLEGNEWLPIKLEAFRQTEAKIKELRERAEKAERERDAAIKELDGVATAVDDLSDFIDEQIHPLIQYDMYLALRENADAISMWQYESEWRREQGDRNEKDSSV